MFVRTSQNHPSTLKVVIVGAGASGAAAACELRRQGVQVENIVILEKNKRVGGKLKTDPSTRIDIGGIIASIGNPVIKYIDQAGLAVENVLPIEKTCLNKMQYGCEAPSFWNKMAYNIQYVYQSCKYVFHYFKNQTNNISVAGFINQHGLTELKKVFEAWVTGMGYGDLKDIPLNRLFTYLQGMVPFGHINNSNPGRYIIRIHGGYQQVIESMLKPFDVKQSIHIEQITRSEAYGINVVYRHKMTNEQTSVSADLLILATPPQAWLHLNMVLTDEENACVNHLEYYRYPVAICDIENLPPSQIFVPKALQAAGFGHVAFISTNDVRKNPEGGRRATVFMNLPKNLNDFSLDEGSRGRDILREDLKKLGYGKVNILKTKVWKDYSTTMPLDIGLNLEKAQGELNTLHATTAMPTSFENVSGAIGYAERIVRSYLTKKYNAQPTHQDDLAPTL